MTSRSASVISLLSSSRSCDLKHLDGRVIVVTGASRGLGAAIASRIAAEGAIPVLVARTSGGLEEIDDVVRASGGEAVLVPMDLSDGAMIDSLGAALYERFGRIDGLIGNAGELGALSPLGHFDPKAWERVMAVNATANYRLIRSLDPLLRQSDAGRAVFVTADVARVARPYWGMYAASKAALEALVLCYAEEVRRTSLRVNIVDPGPMGTRLRRFAYPGEKVGAVASPETLTDAFVDLMRPDCTRHGEIVRLQT